MLFHMKQSGEPIDTVYYMDYHNVDIIGVYSEAVEA